MRIKNVFHSIRWRLVASYVLLTLLTVSLVGVLALSLVKRYVEQQETSYLTANAEAIARQARPLVWPVRRSFALADLARTSSFLGNVRVKIMDKQEQVLADSGPRSEVDQLVVIAPASMLLPAAEADRIISVMILPQPGNSGTFFSSEDGPPLFNLDERHLPDSRVTIIRRKEGMWGYRLVFAGESGPKFISQPDDPHRKIDLEMAEPLPMEPQAGNVIPPSQKVVTVPIGDNNDPLGYVELSNGPNFGTEALVTTRRAFLWAAAGASLIALLVGLWVSRNLTASLRSLSATAGQMSRGDLSVRAPLEGRDEIGQLAQQFNQMAERLEASFAEVATERDTLRRFIADASHELRTPITTLRNFNELLQGAAANDPAAQQEFLAESDRQLRRLEWITQNLLNLSRLEAGLITLNLADCQVLDLLESAHSAFKRVAREKQIALNLSPPAESIFIRCDRPQLEMALTNLLDNALKFTPAGRQVELGAERMASAPVVQIWVKDSGPGIDPADQPFLFERFYRGQNAHRLEGSGLGLAIVQSIVHAHQGRVWVTSEPGSGSRFIIELPL